MSCAYDCNAILTTPMNNIIEKKMIRAFKELTTDLKSRWFDPGFHIMDNEASTSIKKAMTNMGIKYQLVPPSNHRSNNVEIFIQTVKKNFIAELCSVDTYFQLELWDIMLEQAPMSLNILWQSRLCPHILAYTHFCGYFYYNHTLLVPLVTKVVIYNRPVGRASWAPHR